MSKNLKYGVVGVGAIGGYYGGRLANIGKDVHFLYHSEYEWVKTHGLKVSSCNGDFYLPKINAYQSAEDMPQCDVVLVALKSTQNGKLKSILTPICHKDTVVVLVQNGLGLEAELAQDFPSLSIAGGMAFICTSRVGQGEINHADYGALTVGFHQCAQMEILQQMKDDFEAANVPFYVIEDLNLYRWRKLVWNIPYNGLTVALDTSTDKLMQNSSSRQLVQDLMWETVLGARACGANISGDFVEKMMLSTDQMKPYSPSMKLDWDNHRQLEIRAIYSNPIQAARTQGVYLKKVEMLEQMLLFMESEKRK